MPEKPDRGKYIAIATLSPVTITRMDTRYKPYIIAALTREDYVLKVVQKREGRIGDSDFLTLVALLNEAVFAPRPILGWPVHKGIISIGNNASLLVNSNHELYPLHPDIITDNGKILDKDGFPISKITPGSSVEQASLQFSVIYGFNGPL